MKIRTWLRIPLVSLLMAGLLLAGCGTLEVGVQGQTPLATTPSGLEPAVTEEATPQPTFTVEPTAPSEPPTATSPAVSEPLTGEAASTLWAEYRHPEYGFGFAMPCFWLSDFSTLRSYDDLFAMDNSIRGQWADGQAPQGVIKIDVGVWDYANYGIEPGTSLEEALPVLRDESNQPLLSLEPVTVGAHDGWFMQTGDFANSWDDEEVHKTYLFQLSPERWLLFSVLPVGQLDHPDVQAMLDSLVLSPDQEIVRPAFDPAGPVEGRELYIDEEAGYCFQYPAEYELEAYDPSQPGYLGQVAGLTLERPLYTAGLTVDARHIAEGSALEEQVSGYVNQFSDPSVIQRNPPQLVFGQGLTLGGEPAEALEGVPGPDGSRDIFALHDDKLFHLVFTPSFENNPQAANDVEQLYLVVMSSFNFLPPAE